jgi:hypothetical protein
LNARYGAATYRRPAASTPLNIVPGLLGTILTLTMLIFTALSVTREIERGTTTFKIATRLRHIFESRSLIHASHAPEIEVHRVGVRRLFSPTRFGLDQMGA